MIKATYDTNTLASGTFSLQGPAAFIINAWINDEVEMVTSESLLNELSRTLGKSYFASRLTQEQSAFVGILQYNSS